MSSQNYPGGPAVDVIGQSISLPEWTQIIDEYYGTDEPIVNVHAGGGIYDAIFVPGQAYAVHLYDVPSVAVAGVADGRAHPEGVRPVLFGGGAVEVEGGVGQAEP
jgi:hypothetical protein